MSALASNHVSSQTDATAGGKVTTRVLSRLKAVGRAFWTYTEETGQSDTTPFSGWQ